jgi:phosphoribosylanthranilate isomerase
MTVQVKICGSRAEDAFDAAIEGAADWLGFNFFPPSPRAVTAARAAALSARHAGGAARVGLFVDPADAAIADVLDRLALDALQVYAPPARIAELADRFGVPVWRPIGIAAASDLPATPGAAARLLLEAPPPAAATRPGGNARPFDWSLLRGWTAPCPWMLAGGLTPENVAEAIARTGAPAVDVSSGVERAPGEKDPALIRAFLAAVRAAPA